MLPIFIIDPYFWEKCDISENRLNFLVETLNDLDANLRNMGSQLYLLRGSPKEVLSKLAGEMRNLNFEADTEPYALDRDAQIEALCKESDVKVNKVSGHTLLDIGDLEKIGKEAHSYSSFLTQLAKYKIHDPCVMPPKLPSPPANCLKLLSDLGIECLQPGIKLSDLLKREHKVTTTFQGGET